MSLSHFFLALLLAGWLPATVAAPVSVAPDEVHLVPAAHIVGEPATVVENGRRDIASFGFTDSVYRFSVELDNPGTTTLPRLLVVDPTWLDDVRITLVRPDGSQQEQAGGDTLPFAQRAVPDRKINFALDLPPGQSRLLVRAQTRDPFLVGLTLWERSAFFAATAAEAGYYGILYGAIGALLLFNFFLYFSVREKVYGAYVLYLLAFAVSHAAYNGHLYGWLWPEAPGWSNWAHSVGIYLFLIAGVNFAIQFLDLRARLPRVNRWTWMFAAVLAASFLLTALVGGYRLHVASSILWIVVYSPFVLLLGFLSWRAQNRAARYFLTGTTAGFLGSLITALTVSHAIPYSPAGFRAVDYGMLVDAVLLSLALADRLRLARAEADRAKAKLIEAERAHSRELEATVAQRTQELRDANAVKDKFFSIVAHDLRGPIGGLAALFDKRVTTQADLTDERLDLVRASISHTHDFLEELLTWARSQRGEIDCHPVVLDMPALLGETQVLLSPQAAAKGIRLDLRVEERCWVRADPAMTRGILRNLVQNALKFTDSGGQVQASLTCDGPQCRIAISDTGVGMNEETQNSLFRLDMKPRSTPGTRHEPGTGLGLVLCKEFVKRNGGAIGVTSEAGCGSTFWFTLPTTDEVRPAPLEPATFDFSALKILVVEDDPLHREATADILKELGCTPRFAADGHEALRLAQENAFNLILMDIDLPDIDGIETTRRLPHHGSRATLVALSSYSRQEIEQLADDVKFDKYLFKPLTEDAAIGLVLSCTVADNPRAQA